MRDLVELLLLRLFLSTIKGGRWPSATKFKHDINIMHPTPWAYKETVNLSISEQFTRAFSFILRQKKVSMSYLNNLLRMYSVSPSCNGLDFKLDIKRCSIASNNSRSSEKKAFHCCYLCRCYSACKALLAVVVLQHLLALDRMTAAAIDGLEFAAFEADPKMAANRS